MMVKTENLFLVLVMVNRRGCFVMMISDIWYLISGIWYLVPGIRYLISGIRYLISVIWYWVGLYLVMMNRRGCGVMMISDICYLVSGI